MGGLRCCPTPAPAHCNRFAAVEIVVCVKKLAEAFRFLDYREEGIEQVSSQAP
jgi:hypothetical protein